MLARVTQFRYRGVRRSDHDITNDPGVVGKVSLYSVANYLQMTVCDPNDVGIAHLLLPALFEPVVFNIINGGMLFRGYQREGEGKHMPTYFQEWRVEPLPR